MARLLVRPGIDPDDPDEPDVPVVALLVDPDGPPAERAVARLGTHCYEGDGVLHLTRTGGWAEHALAGDRLVVEVAVHSAPLDRAGVDLAAFTGRSSVDPEAVLVLRAEAAVEPESYARAAPATAVFTAGPDETLDDLLAGGESWPMVLAPPPEH
ncbi:hypothetical protein ACFWA9_27730 [Kitasatospora sp. NPDC059973]|uniref:hypothetical protein n=1 Tax=Kitasatospora sp. NPDC059973 TaxID=3347020 RepID=UPI0036CCE6A3